MRIYVECSKQETFTEVRIVCFVENLTEIKKDMTERMNVDKPMDALTYEQKTEFRPATHCSICNKEGIPT